MKTNLLTLCLFSSTYLAASDKVQFPVILIPGDGASQLEARLNKTVSPFPLCRSKTSGYRPVWLNVVSLIYPQIYCLVDTLRLWYDPVTRTTHNTPGVSVRVAGFGGTASVEYLDSAAVTHMFPTFRYFSAIVDALVSIGYVRGVSVRGAPYDFRKAPNELGDYFGKLKDLVEDTYAKNNNSKIVVVAHSLGNLVFLYFLNSQPQPWKDKYIQACITLSAPWGGAVKPLMLLSSGGNFGRFFINKQAVRIQLRSMPSTAFLMPSDQFWKPSDVLVVTSEQNYTVANYKDFFLDMNFPDGYNMRLDTENLVRNLTAPGVAVYCIHGSNIPSPETFVFKRGGFPDIFPNIVTGNGDGTVNMRSLLGCLRWVGHQKYPVIHKVYSGVGFEHKFILFNSDVLKYIKGIVTGSI